VEVTLIRSSRLDLRSMSPAFLEALLGGRRDDAEAILGARIPEEWPDEHDERFLRVRLEEMLADSEIQQWVVRGLVARRGRLMVGHAGFHGPPGRNGLARPGAVEVGYTVFEPFRGRGYAAEAVVALFDWAEEQGVRDFVASVAPENEPSLAVVRKLGFVRTGEQWDDEDGRELVFELTRTPG
jgi:[ribosomal protein S5]-alanine N-acetyltransferase